MSHNAHLNRGDEPELHTAAIHDCKETAIMLLKDYKADINQKDSEGKTALMKSALLRKIKRNSGLIRV